MLPSPRRSAHCRRQLGRGRLGRLAVLTAAFALSVTGIAVAAAASPMAAPATARAAAVTSSAAVAAMTAGHVPAAPGSVVPIPAIAGAPVIRLSDPNPLSTAMCLQTIRLRCYSPVQYQQAYNLNPLYRAKITGKGRTIVIVNSFGSPTIRHDLAVFDRQWGFPNPTLNILALGKIPKFSPGNASMVGWAEETTLDVEYAHAIAPGANILLLETPVAETEGVTGFPEMMNAEKYVIDHNLGDVISQSFGATENTFPGFAGPAPRA